MRRSALVCLLACTSVLAACGGGAPSTLPPAPTAAGDVSLSVLTHHPEVYADATVQTVGVVARAPGHRRLYVLMGAVGGTRVALEPPSSVAREVGRRVRVRGIFTVTFELGYEILVSRTTPLGR